MSGVLDADYVISANNREQNTDAQTSVLDPAQVISTLLAESKKALSNPKVQVFPASNEACMDVVTWLVRQIHLKEPKLKLEARYHAHTDSYGLYVTARYDAMLQGAELVQIRKKLKEQYGGGLKDFVYEAADCYEGVSDRRSFLNSQERAIIIHQFLINIRANADDKICGIEFHEGEPIVSALLQNGVLSQLLPLHNSEDLTALNTRWVTNFLDPQPIDKVCEYFGEKIAMYFAWLGHYTAALTIPAVLGLFHWLFLRGLDQWTDDICVVFFALVNMLWVTVYLESWKRKQAELAYRWGVLQMETDVLGEPRPQFQGNLQISPITGRPELVYPEWKRRVFRLTVSYPVTFLCILVTFLTMLAIFEFQEWCNKYFASGSYLSWVTFFPKILLAIVISVTDEVFHKIAEWLNDMENIRTEETYENNLIIKSVLFHFVNSFLALFYIGFYLQDMDRLCEQLAALLITRQVIGNLKESVLPFVVEKLKLSQLTYNMTKSMSTVTLQQHVEDIKEKRHQLLQEDSHQALSFDDAAAGNRPLNSGYSSPEPGSPSGDLEPVFPPVSEAELRYRTGRKTVCLPIPEFKLTGTQLCQAEVESLLPKYTSPLDDYLEMFVQFGYVILFSPAFPLAAVCALVNNLIEIHVDAFKLCTTFQRPFAERVENIGAWQFCMELMGVVAVTVNCALIAQSGLVQRMWPDLSFTQQILLIIALEHVILALKFVIARAIPDVPQWVSVEMAKMEFKRRETFRKAEVSITKRRVRAESLHDGVRQKNKSDMSFKDHAKRGVTSIFGMVGDSLANVRQRSRSGVQKEALNLSGESAAKNQNPLRYRNKKGSALVTEL